MNTRKKCGVCNIFTKPEKVKRFAFAISRLNKKDVFGGKIYVTYAYFGIF